MLISSSLDTRGKACPLPVLSVKKELQRKSAGEIILVIFSDDEARKDTIRFLPKCGAALLDCADTPDGYVARIQKL